MGAGFNMGIGTGANPVASDFGDVICLTDYITIPGLHAIATAPAATAATDLTTVIGDRICGDDWTAGPNPTTTATTPPLTKSSFMWSYIRVQFSNGIHILQFRGYFFSFLDLIIFCFF